MNKIYRIIWNKSRQCLMVVGENALSSVKSGGASIVDPRSPFARWRRAALAVLALSGAGIPPFALAQTVIAPDGRTQTTVGNTGNVYSVSTATQTGSNAFNSFSAFSVGAGNTVNLYVPSSAINLINLVRDQRTDIYGVLNAIKDGRIGGNVWFANPNGFVVGATGVVNVGSLTVTTPTQQFVDGFFSSPGTPDPASVTQLLAGTAPRNPGAAISVQGWINAVEGVSLSAGAINVAGTIFSGARFIGSAPDFTDVVNANDLVSANNVVVREGRIEIVADGDVAISGTLAAPGGSGGRGGDIAVRAGSNVSLDNGALVSARGNGDNSAGGTVNIQADNDAVARTGALVDASAGTSGDGGAIEFSAKKTVELAGGEFRADGTGGGKGGSVLVDPWNIVVSADILRGAGGYGTLPDGASAAGANLTLLADNEITINENVTLSTRSVAGTTAADHATGASTGNSGSITLEAGAISLKSGSRLLAGADNGYAGGDVLLKATRTWTGEAKIGVDHATIIGRNVALTANAAYNDSILTSWLPVAVPVTLSNVDINAGTIRASGTLNLGATSLIDASTSALSPLGMITAVSSATVDVHGASELTAVGNTTLAASSTVNSNTIPGGPNPATLPGDAGVAINVVVSTAKARVGDTSSVTISGGTLDLTAKNAVTATTSADSTAGGAVAVGGTVALSEVTSVTQAVIDGAATTSSTALKVGAESANVVTTTAKAATQGAKKQTTAEKAAAPSKSEETLATYKDQTTTSDGSVEVAAAVAIANVNSITLADIASTGTQTANDAATVSSKAASSSTVTADGSSTSGSVGVGAAVGVNVGVLVNQARVADNAGISSNGLTVSAVMPDAGKNSFVTTATSGAGASNVGVAGALGTNVLVNTTVAGIEGGGAGSVNVNGGDLVVEAANTSESKLTSGASVKAATATEPAAVGVGASVGMNVAVNTTVAEIEDGASIGNANNVGLSAKGNHTLANAVTGGAAGADISVTPVAAVTVAVNTTTARLGTGSQIDLTGAFTGSAGQTSSTTTTATGQTQGNNVAVGASIALNSTTDTVLAEIDRDISATGEVAIGAQSTSTSSASATASVKGGEKATAADTPPAKSDGSAGKTVDQKVTAQSNAAKTAGKKTAASAPAAASAATADTATKIDGAQEAPKTEDNSQGSGGVSVAAAVGVNAAVATTTAQVAGNRHITSTGGALKVTSANQTDASAKADGSQVDSGNTSVGVGAAVALNVGISTNAALVGDNAVINTKGLTLSAVNVAGEKSDYAAEATSGAGAGNVGVAGSLAANVVVNTTVAALEGDIDNNGSGASVNAGAGDILIEAASDTTAAVKSGADVKGTDAAAKVGVGASIGVNIGVNTTVAEVADKAALTGGKNLGLNATADHTLTTDVTGGATGAKVAVTPLAAVTVAVNTTTARLGESATGVGISGAYSSKADHKGSATTTATGQTEGSNVAVGASIGLTVATDTVTAEIERDVTATNGIELNASSTAKSSTSATASVKGGEKAKDDGSAPAADGGSGSGQSVDQKVAVQGEAAKASGKKVADQAPATTLAAGKPASDKLDETTPPPKTEETTESGGVAVAAAVGINTGIATTVAKVGKDRTISSTDGALKVKSSNETDASAKADGSQIDSGNTSVGVGAAVALNVGISTNAAVVGENSTINTKGLTISAVNASGEKSDYAAEAKSGAGAGNVGVAGSLAANIVVNTTVAVLEGDSTSDGDSKGAVVNGGNGDILIEAANATTSTVKSGADVKGTDVAAKVGVGASIGVNVGVNTVVAEAGDGSEITNGRDFGLNAKADHTFATDVTGGAAGAKVSVTPLAAVTVAVNTTTARFGESPVETTLSGKYSSTAEHQSSATTTATGTTAGSSVAVGVSLGLTSAVDTVSSDVERDINATNGVEVNAKSTAKSSTSATASVSGGDKAKDDGSAPAADGGSGSGKSVDDKVAGQQNKATEAGKTTAAKAPTTTSAAGGSASDKLDTNKQTPPKGETSEGGVSVAAAVGVNVGVATTTARVGKGRHITSSAGALKVTSANQTDTSAKADGSQVDSSKSTDVGVGAAVALNVGVATTTAVVADEAVVSTQGLTLSATGITGEKSDAAAEAKSGAGAGNVGVAGSLAINSATNTTVALLEGNSDSDAFVAQVDAHGGAVLIEAQNATTSNAKVSADVKGTDDKAKVGVGASVGVNVAVNTTLAEVDDGARLIHAGSVGLNASAEHAMTTEATGGAAGAKVSVTPVVAAGIAVNTTVARLGDATTALDVSGAYSSKAEQTSTVSTKATGQAQGDVAVGASLGATIAVDNVYAGVERNLDAGNGIDLGAKSDTSLTTEVKAGAKGAKAAKKDAAGNETPEAGSTVDEQKKNQLDFAKSRNANAAGVNTDTPEAKTPDTTEQAPGTDKPTSPPNNEKQGKKVSVAAAIGATVAYNQAKAEIAAGKTVGAGTGKLKVSSTTDTNYRTLATGEAVSDDVGVAAAVALTATYNKTQANIGSGVTVSDAGDVEVSATSRQNRATDILNTNFQKTMSSEAVSGASGGEVAVAGSLAAVGNWNETRASVDDGVTLGTESATVGDVVVSSDETSKVAAQARAGALSTGGKSKAGVGASFAVVLSYNQNTAAVGYDANNNGGYLPTSIFADSLSVTATKNRVWFLVPTLADAKNFVVNDIKNLNFDALDPSTYLGSNNYYTEAVAGAAAKGNAAVAGAFAVNVFGNTTEAYLGNSVNVTASGKQPAGEQLGVEVAARSDTQAISFVGGVAGAKKAGVGLAATSTVNLDQTLATIGEDSVVKSNADGAGVKVSAYARQDIANVGVAGGIATEGVAVGGVLGAIVSLATTEAKIGDDAEVKSKGNVAVEATADITAVTVAGGVAGGKNVGVGASIGANVLANATRAEIGDNAKVTAKNNLNIAADADEVAVTAVVAGGLGGKIAVSGAFSTNVIVGETVAVVGQGAQINTDAAYAGSAQNVAITARDDTVVVGIAGGGAGGGKAGVGAALDTTVLIKTVKAYVEDDADSLDVANINADRNVQIDASASEVITSVSMGFAGGGNVGVGGAVSIVVDKNDVQAGIGKSAKVDSEGNVLINAQDDVVPVLTAGAGAGGGDAGIGGSLAVATLLGNTRAYVGDEATVNARGNADAATVITGETVFSDTDSTPTALGAKKTESAKGVSVTAYNREDLITTVVGGAGGGTAGVAATVSANVIASTTEASIGQGASVNANNAGAGADQRVRVKAVDETLLIDTAGAGAGGGSAGVGAAANVAVVAKTTTARIGKQATVKAMKAIELDAASSDIVVTTAIGLAGGGSAGVGGAVAGIGVANVTQAFVEDGASAAEAARLTVSAGDLTLNAKEFSSSWLVATGGAGGGAAGVGGSLAAGVNTSTTKARIGDYAETDASGTTTVHADSVENVNTVTIAGAGGGSAGVAGAISTNVIVARTEAGIGKHAQVNQSLSGQNVDVAATDQIVSVGAGGSGAGGGAAGVGVTANVTVALNTTSAYIDNDAVVSAAKDVRVNAASEKYVNSVTFSGAGGGAAGVAGAVSVIAVGSLLDGEARNGLSSTDDNGNTSTTQSQSDGQLNKSAVGSMLGSSAQSTETKGVLDAKASKMAVGQHMADSTPIPLKNTQAFIGRNATVKAGENVTVGASDKTLAINANGAGAGGGAAGVAGSLGVTLLHDSAEAFVADGAKVDADGVLSVKAVTDETVVNVGVTGYGGGAAGVGGSAAVNVVTSSTSAYIGAARINQEATSSTERSVEIEADSNSNLIAVAGSGGGAGAAAVGGVLNVNTLAKSTTAFIGEGAVVKADKNVIVAAQSAQNIVSAGISIQGAGAAAVGGAATANVVANTTEAYIGSARDDTTKTAATVDSDGNVVLSASDDTLLIAASGSGTGAGAAAVGGTIAVNVISSQTRAYVADKSVVNARGNAAGTGVNDGTIDNSVAGAMPSLPAGVSGNVDADNDGVNDGNVGSGASFTLSGNSGGGGGASGALNPSVAKDADGNPIAGAGGGLGAKGTETLKGLSITATGNEKVVTASLGVAGAGAAGVTGSATVNVLSSVTEAGIGDGARINQSGAAGADASVRVRAADNSFVVMASGTLAGAGAAAVSGSNNTAVVNKQTSARIGDADVKANDVVVKASASEDLYLVTANASVAGAAGVGAAAGVGVVTNSTTASIGAGASIGADGGIAVKAEQDTALDIFTVAGSAGLVGVSGAFSVGVIDNTTQAYVEGANTAATAAALDAGGTIEVAAKSQEDILTATVSAAGGGVGVAGAVGVKVVKSDTEAYIGKNTEVNQTADGAAQDVKVSAADTVKLHGGGGALAVAGLAGVGATAEVNVVRNTTKAYIGDSVKLNADRDVSVSAESTKDVQAAAVAASGGGSVGISGAVSLAIIGASLDDDSQNGIGNGGTANAADAAMKQDSVTGKMGNSEHLQSTKSDLQTRTSGLSVSGDLNEDSTSSLDKTRAYIGNSATIVAGRNVSVSATDQTQIKLDAAGAAVGFAGIGGAVGVGITHSTTEASVGDHASIDAKGIVSVDADSANVDANGSSVTSVAGAGGVVAVNASIAVLKDTSTTRAYLENYSDIQQATALSVTAGSNRKAQATALGVGAGGIAIGLDIASASSDSTTRATLGDYVTVSTDNVTVAASGKDDNFASAVAGSGGIISGLAAEVRTSSTSVTEATLGQADATHRIETGNFLLQANHQTLFNGEVDSLNASLVGASGAKARHEVTSTVNAGIGANSWVVAEDVVILAENKTSKDWIGSSNGDAAHWNIRSGSGGLIDLPAGSSESSITHNTTASVGDHARVSLYPTAGTQAFNMDAYNEIVARDKAKLDSGGAVAVARAVSHLVVEEANATASFGPHATVYSDQGNIAAGSRSVIDLDARAAADTYGLAGAPSGEAYAYSTGHNRTTVEDGAVLHADNGQIFLAAGQDSSGQQGSVDARSRVNLWNKTAIPINTVPDARSSIVNNATLELKEGSVVKSAEDIFLYADKGRLNADAYGIGKDIYRELAAAIATGISRLFGGGDVSFDITGGTGSAGGVALAKVDGTAETGIKRDVSLTLEAENYNPANRTWTLKITRSGVGTPLIEFQKSIAEDINNRRKYLVNLAKQYAGTAAGDAYQAEADFLAFKLLDLGLATKTESGEIILGTGGSNGISPKTAAESLKSAQSTSLNTIVITQLPAVVGLLSTTTSSRDQALDTYNVVFANRSTAIGLWATEAAKTTPDAAYIAARKSEVVAAESTLTDRGVTGWVAQGAAATPNLSLANSERSSYNTATVVPLQSEVTSLTAQKTQLETERDNLQANIAVLTAQIPNLSTTAPTGPSADFVTVPDINVRLGSIHVKGDALTGSGALKAPGNAKVDITNWTSDYLIIKDITVDAEAARLTFNGVEVNSTQEISQRNAPGLTASFSEVVTGQSTGDTPEVVILSKYDPDNAAFSPTGPAPDIRLTGYINNPRGLVKVQSDAGSIMLVQDFSEAGAIKSQGRISAATVDVKANNGDFVQSYVDNFFHAGGDPKAIHEGAAEPEGILANGSVFISARYLNINGTIQSGIDSFALTLPENGAILTGSASALGLTLPGNNQAAIDAYRLANPNGTTTFINDRGAVVTYNAAMNRLEVTEAFAVADAASSQGKARNPSGLYGLVSDYGNIGANYDPGNDRYVINGTEVKGGYIQLYGQIMNTASPSAGTGTGKLRVLDGYGQISITNPSGKDIVIAKLDTGRGVAGIIDITDIQYIDAANAPHSIKSVITRENGNVKVTQKGKWTLDANGLPSVFDDNWTDSSTSASAVGATGISGAASSRTATYNPQPGLAFTYTTGQDQSLYEDFSYEGTQFIGISAWRTAANLTQYRVAGPYKSGTPVELDGGRYLSSGRSLANNYATDSTTTVSNGTPTFKTTSEYSYCDWWSLCITQTYHIDFQRITPTKEIVSNFLRADNPIGIEFIGYDTGAITVRSAQNAILTGAINNKAGATTIVAGNSGTGGTGVTAADKNIVQGNDTGLIKSASLSLTASGSVGTAQGSGSAGAVRTAVSGTLDASAANGNVLLHQTLGDLNVGEITAGGSSPSGTARIDLKADGSILAAGGSSLIQGDRVELTSEHGAIGSAAAPLLVNVGDANDVAQRPYYGLKAQAQGNIGVQTASWSGNVEGNLLVDTVVSTGGDVRLVAPGRIIDNNPIEQVDTRTWNELLNYWDSLGLREGSDENLAKQAQSVKSYEYGRTANYRLYWQMRQRQADPAAYDPGFVFTTTAAERAALTAAGVTDIAAYEANRTAQYHQLNAEVGSLNGGAFSDGYAYVVTAAERDAILNKSSWTERELGISINAGAIKTVTNTNPVVKSANVKGATVTLEAGVAIGETSGEMSIPTSTLPQDLTDAQKVALAMAERSDMDVTDALITVWARKPLNFEASTALNAEVSPVVSVHPDYGKVFLASLGDGLLGTISAPDETRIKVRGSIVNAPVSLVQTGNLILEAANGGVGYIPSDGINPEVSAPLQLDLNAGATLTARARNDVDIRQDGDLSVDTVYSRGEARLTVGGSILDAYPNSELNVLADSVKLNALGGSVGVGGNALDVGVNGPDGRIEAQSASGYGVFLNGPSTAKFQIGRVDSGDAVSLSSDLDMLIDGTVTGPGPFTLSSGGRMTMTPKADVHATTLGVYLSAGSLEMQDAQRMLDDGQVLDPEYAAGDAARLRVDVGTIDLETTGDALITGIETGNGTESAIRVVSTEGRILDNGDTRLDIIADTLPAAKLTISAPLGIGDDPLDMRLLNLEATSGGVVDIHVQNGVNIVGITAGDRVWLTAGGDVTGASIVSTGSGGTNPDQSITIASLNGQVDLERVSGTADVSVSGRNGVTVDRLDVGSNVNLAGSAVNASVIGGSGRIGGSVTGFGGGVADSISLVLSGSGGFWLDSLSAATANVNIPLGVFSVDSLMIVDRATITNPWTLALVDQHNRRIQPANVQLYSGGDPFSFMLDRNLVTTTSFVIHNDPEHEVTTPFGTDWAADRQGDAALARLDRRHEDENADKMAVEGSEAVITYNGIPVSLEGGEGQE